MFNNNTNNDNNDIYYDTIIIMCSILHNYRIINCAICRIYKISLDRNKIVWYNLSVEKRRGCQCRQLLYNECYIVKEVKCVKKMKIYICVIAMLCFFACGASIAAYSPFEDVAPYTYFVYNNKIVMQRDSSLCGCDDSHVITYKLSHDHNYQSDLCIVIIREYCDNCGWYRDVETRGIGGHSSYYYCPQWPYDW